MQIAGILRTVILMLLLSATSFASSHVEKILSFDEFKALVLDLSEKVDVYEDVWSQDKEALIVGGSAKEFSLWVVSHFNTVKNRAEALKVMQELRSMPSISSSYFLHPKSDIDVISGTKSFRQKKYRVETVDRARFSPGTPEWRDEINQGYISAEKIVLSHSYTGEVARKNLVEHFGDGLMDIYKSEYKIFIPDLETFQKTQLATHGENHRILLILRYFRLLGAEYYYRDEKNMSSFFRKHISPELQNQISLITSNLEKDIQFSSCITNELFHNRLARLYEKLTSGMIDTRVSLALIHRFGLLDPFKKFAIASNINKILMAKNWDPDTVTENFRKYGISAERFFTPLETMAPNFEVYHGTRNKEDFNSILKTGLIPSRAGSAQEGVYAVPISEIGTAIAYADKNKSQVVKLKLLPTARYVNLVTNSYARQIFDDFHQNYTAFSEAFGVDIITYFYDVDAFVIKNSLIISEVEPLQGEHFSNPKAKLELISKGISKFNSKQILGIINEHHFLESEYDKLLNDLGPWHQKFAEIYKDFLTRVESSNYEVPGSVLGSARKIILLYILADDLSRQAKPGKQNSGDSSSQEEILRDTASQIFDSYLFVYSKIKDQSPANAYDTIANLRESLEFKGELSNSPFFKVVGKTLTRKASLFSKYGSLSFHTLLGLTPSMIMLPTLLFEKYAEFNQGPIAVTLLLSAGYSAFTNYKAWIQRKKDKVFTQNRTEFIKFNRSFKLNPENNLSCQKLLSASGE